MSYPYLLLRQLVDPNYDTVNPSRELTFTELDTNLKNLGDKIAALDNATPTGVEVYDPGTEYVNGRIVSFDDNLWLMVNAIPQTGVTPGTDPFTWEITSSGALSHAQNTDQFLDYGGTYQVSAQEVFNTVHGGFGDWYANGSGGPATGPWDMGSQYLTRLRGLKDDDLITYMFTSNVDRYLAEIMTGDYIVDFSRKSTGLGINTNDFFGYVKTDNLTAIHTWQHPNKSGTYAMMDDIDSLGNWLADGSYGDAEGTWSFAGYGFENWSGSANTEFPITLINTEADGSMTSLFVGGVGSGFQYNNAANDTSNQFYASSLGNGFLFDLYNSTLLTRYRFDTQGITLVTNTTTGAETTIANDLVMANYKVQFPNKPLGIETFAMVSDLGGASATELSYLIGLTSNAQGQINNINANIGGWKNPARVISFTNINLASPGTTIDAITMAVGESFVAAGQSTGSQNGVYIYNGSAVAATRRSDCTTGGTGLTGILGMVIGIEEGTHAEDLYALSNNAPITVGTTSLSYVKTSATTYTAGAGLQLTGNQFSVDSTVALLTAVQTLTNKTLTSPVINVGSDATGDTYYRNSGTFTRRAIGSTNDVYSVSGGVPAWQSIATLLGYTAAKSMTVTAVKTANYTAAPEEIVRVDTTAGNVTISLPVAPPDKTKVTIVQVIKGTGFSVSALCGGSDVLNRTGGATSTTITLLAEAKTFEYKASDGTYTITSSNHALSQLDLRFEALANKATDFTTVNNTLYPTVAAVDVDRVRTVKVSLSSAQILALNTSPQTLLPAPGVGKAIQVLGLLNRMNFLTAAYATNLTVNIRFNTAGLTLFSSATVINATATRTTTLPFTAPSGNTASQVVENDSLIISVGTGNPTAGGGSLDLYISYKIVSL